MKIPMKVIAKLKSEIIIPVRHIELVETTLLHGHTTAVGTNYTKMPMAAMCPAIAVQVALNQLITGLWPG